MSAYARHLRTYRDPSIYSDEDLKSLLKDLDKAAAGGITTITEGASSHSISQDEVSAQRAAIVKILQERGGNPGTGSIQVCG